MDINQAVNALDFHSGLNQALWNKGKLRIDVRVTLLRSAWAFVEFLDVPSLVISSIHLTGSNANYNYTQWSDCDVHLVVDYSTFEDPEIAENFFHTKKTLWNALHDGVRVNGFPVELYVEDAKHPVTANGVYDLLNDKWVKKPTREKPHWEAADVIAKSISFIHQINAAISANTSSAIHRVFEKLKSLRRAGLEKSGEFSTENLTFKTLRNLGFVGKLAKARQEINNFELSLDKDTCREPICEFVDGGLNRCTVQTVNAFAAQYHFPPIAREADIPQYSEQVVAYLEKYGLKPRALPEAIGQTVMTFVNSHRTGTFYISTDGHAMALINGQLVDAAQKGSDQRKIVSATEFRH